MKFSNLKKQRGAVLAFSLMMLLLLTLAGVNMIQQNKQQLAMSNNARLFTQEFANAESVLEDAKAVINSYAAHDNYNDPRNYFPVGDRLPIYDSSHQCTPTLGGKQDIGLAGNITLTKTHPGTATAKITSVKCRTYGGAEQVCSSYNGSSTTTYTNSQCYQDYDPRNAPAPLPIPCPKEIYTIEVTSTSTTNGALRKITSDHVVGCGW